MAETRRLWAGCRTKDGPVGAAWYRMFTEASHGYGFVAEDVPELSIAVIASRRHEGIGRRLLVDLIDASLTQGYPAMSLSVREDNPARGLYESAGFVRIEKHANVLDNGPTRGSFGVSGDPTPTPRALSACPQSSSCVRNYRGRSR